MESLHDKVLIMMEEFQERTRSLKGGRLRNRSEQWCETNHLPWICLLQRYEFMNPSLLVVHETLKTWTSSSRTWSNTLVLLGYLLVNKK